MSAGGLIAQALLGATGSAAQGVGERLRADAQLKRQKALDKARSQNSMVEQSHQSALAIGRDNLQRDHQTQENSRQRQHELEMADKKYGQQKGLMDYDLNAKLTLAKQKAEESGALSEWQTTNLDRINGDIDHLQTMERDLMTGKSDGMQINLAGLDPESQPQDSAGKLAIIRQRIKAKELAFNRVLGNRKGMDAGAAVLTQAANVTDPRDREEFLADLKGSSVYSESLVRDIREVWGSSNQATQAEQQPSPSPTPTPEPASQPQPEASTPPQPEPTGGLLARAQEPQAAPPPAPNAEQPAGTGSPNPDAGRPLMEQRLGPKIEAGARAVGDAMGRMADSNRREAAMELSRIARGEQQPYQGNIRQFLMNNPEAVRMLSPEDLQRLRQRYGDQLINQFLQ